MESQKFTSSLIQICINTVVGNGKQVSSGNIFGPSSMDEQRGWIFTTQENTREMTYSSQLTWLESIKTLFPDEY